MEEGGGAPAGSRLGRDSRGRVAPQKDPAGRGRWLPDNGGGTAERLHTAVTRPSGSVGEDRDFMCF